MPEAIVPGLYSLSGGVNLFVLDDADSGVTIIDAGMPGSTKRILELVRAIGRTPQDVKQILITHADLDHVGSLHGLVKATGAPVYASKQAAQYIQKRQSPPHLTMPFKAFAAVVNLVAARATPVDHIVTSDQVLDMAGGIRVIATPGHTPDHVSFFWERARVLFVGDLLRNEGKLTPSPARITWDMGAVKASAQKLLALDPAVMVFGHGETWTKDADPDGIAHLLAAMG